MIEQETKKPCCPNCGTEEGIYARADLRWQPKTQSWDISEVEDTLDCTECDHEWSLSNWLPESSFPADLREASSDIPCQACGRPEWQCNASPCEAVERDREA